MVNGVMSPPKILSAGFLKGLFLGPECWHNSSISLYADDTEIYNSSADSNDLIAKTNGDLENVG